MADRFTVTVLSAPEDREKLFGVLDTHTGRTCYRDSRWPVVSSQCTHLNRGGAPYYYRKKETAR